MKNLYITGLLLLIVSSIAMAAPVGSRFSYQGKLQDVGSPANGVYDFRMEIWSTETGGNVVGQVNLEDVSVVNGLFTVELDFGSFPYNPFNGEDNFLKIQVREGSSTGSYTALNPRQRINAVPYAIQSESVENSSSPWEDITGGIGYTDDVKIGNTGTATSSMLTVDADVEQSPIRLKIAGGTKMILGANGGTSFGRNTSAPEDGIRVEGDANQALTSHGFVKAGAFINCGTGGSSNRFFNNYNGNDFTFASSGTGRCDITVPFDISNAFYVVSAVAIAPAGSNVRAPSCRISPTSSNTLHCSIRDTLGGLENGELQIIIY